MNDDLAELMLSRFRGRADVHAVAAGDAFGPDRTTLTVDKFRSHHLGKRTCLGFYLMQPDNRVACSCADIDNHDGENSSWRSDTEQVCAMLNALDVPHVVEVSQSGEGAHVWIFFDEAADAWVPRAFWRSLAGKIKVSLREVYPRQDKLVGKELGNLVRFPLWNASRFVDIDNEWAELDTVVTLRDLRTTSSTDLKLMAFQAGLGTLIADPTPSTVHIEGMTDIVPVRVARLLDNGSSLLFRRWNADGAGMADSSKSSIAMSLCCELVRGYVPTPEIASTLRAWCGRHDYHEKGSRDDWINRTVAKAYDFVVQRKEKMSTGVSTFRDAAHAFIDQIEKGAEIRVPSGMGALDKLVGGGVAPGEVAIVAGRPSHGKSAVGFQWVGHAASLGVKGLVISEEMSRLQIGKRRVMTISGIPCEQWVAASASALRRDVDAYHQGHADVFVVESCGTVDRAEEVIDQFCTLHDVGFVMIDYLQLLGTRGGERYEVVTEASRRIKQAAVRNNVPILLLCQLNRSIENRDDHEPKLSDLRESGQIEQDADQVFFCVYPSRFTEAPDDLYVIYCGKNRNGPGGGEKIETSFNPHRQIVGFDELPDTLRDL